MQRKALPLAVLLIFASTIALAQNVSHAATPSSKSGTTTSTSNEVEAKSSTNDPQEIMRRAVQKDIDRKSVV